MDINTDPGLEGQTGTKGRSVNFFIPEIENNPHLRFLRDHVVVIYFLAMTMLFIGIVLLAFSQGLSSWTFILGLGLFVFSICFLVYPLARLLLAKKKEKHWMFRRAASRSDLREDL